MDDSGINEITDKIIGAAIEVHSQLGPGLLESAYEICLCYELGKMGLRFHRQTLSPIKYKGVMLDCGYRLDLIVEDAVIVELKSIDAIDPIHIAQLLTYLRSAGKHVGLLINFNVAVLKTGIKRVVNEYTGPALPPRLSPRLGVSAVKSKAAVK